MPTSYETIKAQLTEDLTAALGEGGRIFYGRLVKPKPQGKPTAAVFTGIDRKGVVRQVQETFGFGIYLMVPLPAPTDVDTDVEGVLMGIADALVARLAPYAIDGEVPPSAGPYAGVGSLRRVESIKPMAREDAEAHAGIVLTFSCMATVLQ